MLPGKMLDPYFFFVGTRKLFQMNTSDNGKLRAKQEESHRGAKSIDRRFPAFRGVFGMVRCRIRGVDFRDGAASRRLNFRGGRIHRFDYDTPIDETMQTLDELPHLDEAIDALAVRLSADECTFLEE